MKGRFSYMNFFTLTNMNSNPRNQWAAKLSNIKRR